MLNINYDGDVVYGAPYVSRVRYAFSRRCKDFFDPKMDKRFSKNIVHVRVAVK